MSSNSSDGGSGDTIVSIPKSPTLQTLVHNSAKLDEGSDVHETQFKIRLANTESRRRTQAT